MTIATVVGLVLGLGLAAEGSQFTSGQDIETVEGQVRLSRERVVFEEGFEGGLEAWEITNFEDAHSGNQSLLITRSGERVDTAFELASVPIAVQPDTQYTLHFWCKPGGPESITGFKGKYMTQLQWRNAEGQPVGASRPAIRG